MDKKPVKDKVKAKAKTVKDKAKDKAKAVKDKVKGAVKVLAIAFLCAAPGCMDTAPASRYTASTVGDIVVKNNVDDFRNRPGPWATNGVPVASAPLVSIMTTIKLSDMTMASADSAGSTETQTATPTMDIKPDVDVHYNDPVGTGGNAVATFTSSLTSEGMAILKDCIANKKSGEITVTKTDGTTETLTCKDGKCTTSGGLVIDSSNCTDCEVRR